VTAGTDRPVAVLGGGAGGHAMAYYLASLGRRVKWWLANAEDAAAIADAGSVTAIGAFAGSRALDRVSDDVGAVLADAGLVFIVLPANAHDAVAAKIAPHLRGDETILLNPGRTGGAVCFRRAIAGFRPARIPTVGETQSLIFTCRRIRPGVVDFLKFKNFGQCAFLGPVDGDAAAFLRSAFPQMRFETSTLATGLANVGAMLHPAPVLFNIGRIEDPGAPYLHYYEGFTPTVASFIEGMDGERLRLAEAFGFETANILEWHELCYGLRGKTLFETFRLNQRYASLHAPDSLDHRYIHEDVPTGLVPMIALAEAVGHDVPCMKIILALADLVLDRDFRRLGRNAAAMGFAAGASVAEITGLFAGAGGK